MTVISFPIPPYSNVAPQPQFYQPSRFVITAITLGQTTTITTSVNHNFVVGQSVRILVPNIYGSYFLNERHGLVLSIPAANQVVVNVNSTYSEAFLPNAVTASITGATKANPCVLTANNSFKRGNNVQITGVVGMTQLNAQIIQVLSATSTTITLNVNSTGFSNYVSGGVATLYPQPLAQPQITAIGDVNAGQTNANGINSVLTFIPGSFINIS